MKLINLNVWIKIDNSKEIWEFLKKQNPDIIAFQEILRHFDEKVFEKYKSKEIIEKNIWKDFKYSFFWPVWLTEKMFMNNKIYLDFGGFVEQWNQFISKYPIEKASNEFFYWNYELKYDWTDFVENDHSRAILVSYLNIEWKKLKIINIHWTYSKDKLDSERSFLQCKKVLEIAKREELPTIIVGDFNLFPETKSIKIIEKEFKNLITEYNIKTTRPDFKDHLDVWNNVVDYIFVNEKIKVNNFEVIDTDISDHLPLILNFKIV